MMTRVGFFWVLIAGLTTFGLGAEESQRIELFDRNPDHFSEQWRERGFPLIAPTQYRIQPGKSGSVVRGRSDGGNRALFRESTVEKPTVARLSWRWRVTQGLKGEVSERTRAGDDFAARVFVVFETSIVPTRTRAINYVWAAKEAKASVFPSLYTNQVAHIVLRSGAAGDAERAWFAEERDVLADYESFFGEPAAVISAVAIMVDADNTAQVAEAEFTGLFWEISSAGGISNP